MHLMLLFIGYINKPGEYNCMDKVLVTVGNKMMNETHSSI